MKSWQYAYEDAAKEYAKVYHVDEVQRKAFLSGVKWAAGKMQDVLRPSCYENTEGYPKKMLDGMTLDDVKELLRTWMKGDYVEQRP